MADPVLHIKDSYYFEVPKFLWRYNYESLHEAPEFLVKAHPEATVEDFNRELSGKILIPQPFGTLKNLYEKDEKEWGFAISKFMVLELFAAIIVGAVFIRLARRVQTGERPQGRWWNLLEAMVVFVRDEIARPSIGKHDADRFVPLLWSMFFFILVSNLLGLVPWLGTPSGAWGTTLGLACVTLATTLGAGMVKFGPIGFWVNQVPHMELAPWMFPLKIIIFLIEVVGLFIKHIVLSVRLLANMVAGHLVLLAILGFIVTAATLATPKWAAVTSISVIGSALLSLLELFVAFLQAYIFTFLSALFIGAAVHRH